MNLKKIKQKRGAIELSIGTVVIIVLAMTMLILGLVLVRTIFTGATQTVDTLNAKIRGEINNLFTEEESKIAIRLGADKIAKVKQGERLGTAIGAETRNSDAVTNTNLKYSLEKTNEGGNNCEGLKILDHTFSGSLTVTDYQFEDTESSHGYVILFFDIGNDAPECTQRIKVHTKDTTGEIASSSFRVQILPKGIFS